LPDESSSQKKENGGAPSFEVAVLKRLIKGLETDFSACPTVEKANALRELVQLYACRKEIPNADCTKKLKDQVTDLEKRVRSVEDKFQKFLRNSDFNGSIATRLG
jgi:hypothetical protein